MRLDTLQQLRMEQKLRLAPRMIQSMEILQLPLMALEERIAQEMEKNPILEFRESEEEPNAEAAADEDHEAERDLVIDGNHDNKDDFDRLDNIEDVIQPEEFLDRPRAMPRGGDDEDPKMQALANTAAREVSLDEFLMSQWDLADVDPQTKQIGDVLISHIDPDGYFRSDFQLLARENNLPDDPELWEKALMEIQKLEPPGVGARNARECLLLQLDALIDERPVERDIIANYFEELQNQQFQKISKLSGYSIEQIKTAVEFVRLRLNLHPGLTVGSTRTAYVVPDVIVEYDEDTDSYKVIVPDNHLPRLYIAGHYRKMLQDPGVDSTTRKFIKSNMQSANWIIEAIEQRRETLRKVAQVIVDAQREFLESGPKYMKPLPMSQVAEKVGIHVATVSRAVAEKYILTPRGIFPLRSFFIGGTETDNGESVSWDAIRVKIQEFVSAEDKTDPLSDDQIIDLLKKDGITVARRTVTKYRKLLGIPSSHKRREK